MLERLLVEPVFKIDSPIDQEYETALIEYQGIFTKTPFPNPKNLPNFASAIIGAREIAKRVFVKAPAYMVGWGIHEKEPIKTGFSLDREVFFDQEIALKYIYHYEHEGYTMFICEAVDLNLEEILEGFK